MKVETKENLEEAVNACFEEVEASEGESKAQNLKAAIEGYQLLKKEDDEQEEKKNLKKKLLTWFGGILAVLIPAIVVEGMQEKFMDKQANKAYEFEKTGTLTTTPGRNFVGGMFKSRKSR